MPDNHLRWILYGGEVVGFVPLNQQIQVGKQFINASRVWLLAGQGFQARRK